MSLTTFLAYEPVTTTLYYTNSLGSLISISTAVLDGWVTLTTTIVQPESTASSAQSEASSATPLISTSSHRVTSSTHSPLTTPTSPSSPDSALSEGAKIGIGVGIGLCIVAAIAVFCLFIWRRRRRNASTREDRIASHPGNADEQFDNKQELYADHVDSSTTHGPTPTKPELSTAGAKHMPPELDDTLILEAGDHTTAMKAGHNRGTTRRPLASRRVHSSSQESTSDWGSNIDSSQTAVGSGAPSRTLTSSVPHRSMDAELIEEADAAVAELGLLAVRKKALISQASATGKKAEDVVGRKGEEYRQLLEREAVVRRRMDEIDIERSHET